MYSLEFPDYGATAGLTDLATSLRMRSLECEQAKDLCRVARGELDESRWKGGSGTEFRSRMTVRVMQWDRLAEVCLRGALAVGAYVREMERIAREAEAARHNLAKARDVRQQATVFQMDNPILAQSSWGSSAMGPYVMQAEQLESSAWSVLQTMHADRQHADQVLCDALAGLETSSAATGVQQALFGAGHTSLMDVQKAEIAEAMIDYARTVIDSGGEDMVAAEGLAHLLLLYGDDPVVAQPFFDELGAEGVVALVGALGLGVAARGTKDGLWGQTAALRLRDAFAKHTHWWSPQKSDEFLAAVMGADVHGKISALGFLAGDPLDDTWGRHLSIAFATMVDEIERDPAGRGPLVETDSHTGGAILSKLLDGEVRTNDLGARALGMLGQHHDEALAWMVDAAVDPITDKSLGAARMEYWFGRDSSTAATGDGFEGVMTLLTGALQASGGPADVNEYDEEIWEHVATVITQAGAALGANSAFVPENLSPAGAAWTAGAVALALPHLSEQVYEYNRNLDAQILSGDRRLFVENELPGMDEMRPVPNLSKAEAENLFAAATSTQVGRRIVDASSDGYMDALMVLGHEGLENPQQVQERIRMLYYSVDGSEDAGHDGVQRRHDEHIERVVGHVSTAAGMAPIPGADKIPGLAAEALDVARDQLLDYGKDQAISLWSENLDRATAETNGRVIDPFADITTGVEGVVLDSPEERALFYSMDDLGLLEGKTDSQKLERFRAEMSQYDDGRTAYRLRGDS